MLKQHQRDMNSISTLDLGIGEAETGPENAKTASEGHEERKKQTYTGNLSIQY